MRHGVPSPGKQSRIHRRQSAGMPEQDQRSRRRNRNRCPQDAGNLIEGEGALDDVVVEALFGQKVHERAFRECS
jgi:hypothetical protein